ncbi:hypothetical protein [Azospirillum sp. ST 5-10]|uniref:hypothetical protein n=1 Tax=unclassified Azospirillum TaxID=2630922 RepID=UPI003F4A16D3
MAVITLCGSTRFKAAFQEWAARLTLQGNVVLSIAVWRGMGRADPAPDEKAILDEVHLSKIRLSDAVLVLDLPVDGQPYIGESTRNEIAFAERRGLPVLYLSALQSDWWAAPEYRYAPDPRGPSEVWS